MNFAVCCVPVSPLRPDPSHKSEMVTQLLFGETCTIVETKDQWARIKCHYDDYEGWCQDTHLTYIEKHDAGEEPALTSALLNQVIYNSEVMMIPMGCSLTAMKDGKAAWGNNKIQYYGAVRDESNSTKDEHNIRGIALKYLNTAYLWGGKSNFGIDCSGFSQTVYKFLHHRLLRDAWQQATQGEVVALLQDATCGDLAFFDSAEGKITHVGILLNDHEIIHASGKVRIDGIDNFGIVNRDSSVRTHQLRMIKRYFTSAQVHNNTCQY